MAFSFFNADQRGIRRASADILGSDCRYQPRDVIVQTGSSTYLEVESSRRCVKGLGLQRPRSANCLPPARRVTLSVVSHGHGSLLLDLLQGLNSLPQLEWVRLSLQTLNVIGEELDPSQFRNLHLKILRNSEPRGFAENHNRAFGYCATPWFGVLNPDLRVPEDVFTKLLSGVGEDERIALLVPKVINSRGVVEDSVRANLTPWALLNRRLRNRKLESIPGHKFRWYAGMFLLIRSSAYAAIGGFDERFFLYCEDYDLCARLHLKSYKLIQDPSISVVHDPQRHSRTRGRYSWWHLKSIARVWTSRYLWRIAVADLIAGLRGSFSR